MYGLYLVSIPGEPPYLICTNKTGLLAALKEHGGYAYYLGLADQSVPPGRVLGEFSDVKAILTVNVRRIEP